MDISVDLVIMLSLKRLCVCCCREVLSLLATAHTTMSRRGGLLTGAVLGLGACCLGVMWWVHHWKRSGRAVMRSGLDRDREREAWRTLPGCETTPGDPYDEAHLERLRQVVQSTGTWRHALQEACVDALLLEPLSPVWSPTAVRLWWQVLREMKGRFIFLSLPPSLPLSLCLSLSLSAFFLNVFAFC